MQLDDIFENIILLPPQVICLQVFKALNSQQKLRIHSLPVKSNSKNKAKQQT